MWLKIQIVITHVMTLNVKAGNIVIQSYGTKHKRDTNVNVRILRCMGLVMRLA